MKQTLLVLSVIVKNEKLVYFLVCSSDIAPYQATAEDHADGFQSNMEYWWRPDGDTLHPSLWRSLNEWSTSWPAQTQS